MEKIKKLMNIDFNTKSNYRDDDDDDDDKDIKTKIKTYKNNITTNFCNKKESKKVPEKKISRKYLSIIISDFVFYPCEKYHPPKNWVNVM